jgi:membrane fusion protein, multidrug efflux system
MKFNLEHPTVRRAIGVIPILVGVLVLAWLRSNAREPQKNPENEQVRVLRVIRVPTCDVVPRVEAYGTVEPSQVWRAVAEVKGRVTRVHDELRPGSILRQGVEILQVDRAEYDLAVSRLNADIAQANAQLAELDAAESNDKKSLVIEQKLLTVAMREQDRLAELAKTNAATQANLDAQTRQTLAQQQKVQTLQNSLNLVPSKRDSLNATITVKQASKKQAEIDASKTRLVAPYDCRLADVSIEVGQFIAAGELLFEAHNTAAAEVEAQVPVDQASTLILPRDSELGSELPSMQAVRDLFRIKATVTNATGSDAANWEAKFLRIRETIDPQTRTVGLVVGVDRPYEKIIPGRRPPLVKGTFCRVELKGEVRANRIVIPRSAVHDGSVYVLDSENRLRRRPVEIEFSQGAFSVVSSGLDGDELLVVSDPTPAIDGMLINSVEDTSLLNDVVAEATSATETILVPDGAKGPAGD